MRLCMSVVSTIRIPLYCVDRRIHSYLKELLSRLSVHDKNSDDAIRKLGEMDVYR